MNNVTFPDNPAMDNLKARVGRSDAPSWSELEAKEREAANHKASLKNNGLGGNIVGMAGDANQCGPEPCTGTPKTLSGLIYRIQQKKAYAELNAQRASKLGELYYLLDRNPDVARILELMDEVGR